MKTGNGIGADDRVLRLEVTVSMPGIARTVANQLKLGGQWRKLAESKVEGGGIPTARLGSARLLRSSCLRNETIADFGVIAPSQWNQPADKFLIRYRFSGG